MKTWPELETSDFSASSPSLFYAGLLLANHSKAQSCLTSPGNTTSTAFVLFDSITTKSKGDVNQAKIVKSQPA
jgi:hypothetical protein